MASWQTMMARIADTANSWLPVPCIRPQNTARLVTVALWPLGMPPSPKRRSSERPPFITAWRIVLMTWAKNQAESAVIR